MLQFTLSNDLVEQSLLAVANVNGIAQDLDLTVVGGIACQLYIEESQFFRPTNDLDVMSKRRIENSEFKGGLGQKILEHLNQFGYEGMLRESQFSHEIIIEDNLPFYIHISRHSRNYYNRHQDRIARETSNANHMLIPDSEQEIAVVRMEDIVSKKALRLEGIMNRGYLSMHEQEILSSIMEGDIDSLCMCDFELMLGFLIPETHELYRMDPATPGFSERLGIKSLKTFMTSLCFVGVLRWENTLLIESIFLNL